MHLLVRHLFILWNVVIKTKHKILHCRNSAVPFLFLYHQNMSTDYNITSFTWFLWETNRVDRKYCINLCLGVKLDSLSCPFTSKAYFANLKTSNVLIHNECIYWHGIFFMDCSHFHITVNKTKHKNIALSEQFRNLILTIVETDVKSIPLTNIHGSLVY